MSPRSYLAYLVLFTLLGAVCVIGAVATIDPYGLFNIVSIERFNSEKTERLAHGGRFIKSIDLLRKDFKILILGSSRALQGIQPSSPAFRGTSAYNGAIPETDMSEVHKIGVFALERRSYEQLVIGIDFHMFLEPQDISGDFSASAFSGDPVPVVVLRRLLSIAALVDSGKTVIKNALGRRSPFLADGALDQERLMQKPDHWRWFQWRLGLSTRSMQGRHYSPASVNQLKDLVVRARQLGVDVRIFISPTHAQHLETLWSMGLFPAFEQWKRDVTKAIAEANDTATPATAAQLWDFSGYNRVTTEAIPGPGDATRMRWYWELSHYKQAAGDLILARILQRGPSLALDGFDDFGLQLTEANIEKHLAAIRVAQARYREMPSQRPTLASQPEKRHLMSN